MPDVAASYNLVVSADGAIGIQLVGRIDHRLANPLIKALKTELVSREPIKVTVDLNRISYFDDFGVLVLAETQADPLPINLRQVREAAERQAISRALALADNRVASQSRSEGKSGRCGLESPGPVEEA